MVEYRDLKQKTSIAVACAFALLLQNVSAYASSWNPGLLVNTETFQIIDDTDTASDLYVRFGDALNKRLTFERTLDRFNFNDDVYISGNITTSGTASGKILHAQDTLSSSGSLVWEGSAPHSKGQALHPAAPMGKLSHGTPPPNNLVAGMMIRGQEALRLLHRDLLLLHQDFLASVRVSLERVWRSLGRHRDEWSMPKMKCVPRVP
ncbi:MAG: hypothetical protein Greene041662_879 [Candidatus Peregrinibacteria bacterium Greene0416_62]|nr:MAG: hypothetical protein Greene041662_879 [Candidatus Peregrinibacteria bacterium Greene0416_62]